MTMHLKNKFFSGIIWSAGDKLINQLGYLGVTLYIARIIGPEAFGLIGMLTIFSLLAESVVNNGFSQALVQKSKQLSDADSSTIFYVNLLWSIIIYVLLYYSAPLIADFYNTAELVSISRILFLIVIINSLVVVVRAKLLIKVDFRSLALSGFVATTVSSAVALYLASQNYSYWSLVWLMLIRSAVNNICLWILCRWWPNLIFSRESLAVLFKFGSNLMLAGFVATFVNNLYVALIGRFFNPSSVGYFTQAANLTNFLSQFISSTLQGVTYPLLTSIKNEPKLLVALYKKIIAITMLGALPALIGFAGVAKPFVDLFLGEDWIAVVPLIQILCLARAITPISVINMNILNAIGRSDLFLKVDLIKLPINLLTLLISVNFGLTAVAYSLLINSIISFYINSYYPNKFFGFGAFEQIKAARNYLVSAILMFVFVQFIQFESPKVNLALGVIGGMLIYFSTLIVLNDQMFKSVCKEIRFRISLRFK